MPRTTRMISSNEKSVYHVISRTALDGLPFGPVEKDRFVTILKRFARIYFTEILGYAVMDNHVHILVRMLPERNFSDEEITARYRLYYGDEAVFPVGRIGHFRQKWASLSEFVREVKQTFSRYYNKKRGRRANIERVMMTGGTNVWQAEFAGCPRVGCSSLRSASPSRASSTHTSGLRPPSGWGNSHTL